MSDAERGREPAWAIGLAALVVVVATWIIVAAARQFPPPAQRAVPPQAERPSAVPPADRVEERVDPSAVEKTAAADSTARAASTPKKASADTSAKPAPRPAAAPVASRELPPFPKTVPPLGMSPVEPPSGPPPNVLWLAGVIQGEPSLAMLRRGDNRYLAKEGDVIEGRYRVVEISPSQVKLQRGARRITLRLGSYR